MKLTRSPAGAALAVDRHEEKFLLNPAEAVCLRRGPPEGKEKGKKPPAASAAEGGLERKGLPKGSPFLSKI